MSASGALGAIAIAGAFAAGFFGCDRGTQKNDPGGVGPNVHVVGIAVGNVAASRADDGVEIDDVPPDGAIRIRLDRFLLPSSTVRQAIRVTSGMVLPDGGATPAGVDFEEPFYDVLERVVVFRSTSGWIADTLYTATIWAPNDPANPTGVGFTAFDGAPLEKSLTFRFKSSSAVAPSEPPVFHVDYCNGCFDATGAAATKPDPTNVYQPGAVSSFATGGCLAGSCHGEGGPGAEQGLDMATTGALARTAIGMPAHQTETGPSSKEAPHNPALFGAEMPIIDPGVPANSYFLYKLLINPDIWTEPSSSKACAVNGDCLQGQRCDATSGTCVALIPREPVPGDEKPSDDEVARLRSFVMGSPMPFNANDGGVGSVGMPIEAVRVFQQWIANGAPLSDATCPKDANGNAFGSKNSCAPAPATNVNGADGGDGGDDGGDAGDGG